MGKIIYLIVFIFISINKIYSLGNWSVPRFLLPRSSNEAIWLGDMVTSDNTIHLVYSKSLGDIYNWYEIYYMKSIDDIGERFSKEVRLTNSDGCSVLPVLAVSGNHIHIIWWDSREGGNFYLYYKHSLDGGNTWSEDKKLIEYKGFDFKKLPYVNFYDMESNPADITVNGNYVHIVVAKDDLDIYYIRSTDGGNTFDSEIRLTNDSWPSYAPVVVSKNNSVHVFWYDSRDWAGDKTEIYYKRSLNNGSTWEADRKLTYCGPYHYARTPRATIDTYNIIHLIYDSSSIVKTSEMLYYMRSTDNGVSWTDTFLTQLHCKNIFSHITSGLKDDIHIIFTDFREKLGEVYYKYGFNFGSIWSEDIRLPITTYSISYRIEDGFSYPNAPNIAMGIGVTDKAVNIVWYDSYWNAILYSRESFIERLFKSEEGNNLLISPNPYSPSNGKNLRILYKIPSEMGPSSFIPPLSGIMPPLKEVYLKVYTISGELVKTLINGEERDTGWLYETNWDGKNERGETVCRGLYLINLYSPWKYTYLNSRGDINEYVRLNEVKKLVIK